jgi:hypothetical protein
MNHNLYSAGGIKPIFHGRKPPVLALTVIQKRIPVLSPEVVNPRLIQSDLSNFIQVQEIDSRRINFGRFDLQFPRAISSQELNVIIIKS